LFSDPHKTRNALRGQKAELLNVKLVIHIVTTGFYKVNKLFGNKNQSNMNSLTVSLNRARVTYDVTLQYATTSSTTALIFDTRQVIHVL
jgi:hypothetical protein